MILRVTFNEAAREKATKILDYAKNHPYVPGGSLPGHDHNLVGQFDDVRVVFSFTHAGNTIYRHLSASIAKRGRYPQPVMVYALAELFGFTGWTIESGTNHPDDWIVRVLEEENAVGVVQPIGAIDKKGLN